MVRLCGPGDSWGNFPHSEKTVSRDLAATGCYFPSLRAALRKVLLPGRPFIIPGLGYVLLEVGRTRRELVPRQYAAFMRKQRLSVSVIFRPVILRKMRAMGISMLGR